MPSAFFRYPGDCVYLQVQKQGKASHLQILAQCQCPCPLADGVTGRRGGAFISGESVQGCWTPLSRVQHSTGEHKSLLLSLPQGPRQLRVKFAGHCRKVANTEGIVPGIVKDCALQCHNTYLLLLRCDCQQWEQKCGCLWRSDEG